MAKKFDGVIEAVHYNNGQIATVRVFERRGATFSDRVLVDRKEFLERLKNGQKYVVGKRKEFWAGTFEVQEEPAQVLNRNGLIQILAKQNGKIILCNSKKALLSLHAR